MHGGWVSMSAAQGLYAVCGTKETNSNCTRAGKLPGAHATCGHHLPTCLHAAACDMQGSLGERVTSFFIGGAPCLQVEEVVYSPGDRFRLQTVSGGVVHLQLGECEPVSGVSAWRTHTQTSGHGSFCWCCVIARRHHHAGL